MMDYRIGIFLNKFDSIQRDVNFGVEFKDDFAYIISGINTCDYSYTEIILENLEKLMNKEIEEYEWGGGERIWFESTNDKTIIIDNFGWNENVEIETVDIMEVMQDRFDFMNSNSRNELVTDILNAFQIIKSDKEVYLYDDKRKSYRLMLPDHSPEFIQFTLIADDFNLDKDILEKQLRFNDKFYS